MTWVIGSHGLLGQRVDRLLPDTLPTPEVPWLASGDANLVLRQGIRTLLDRAGGGDWNIAWWAGAGIVATPRS